MKMGPEKIDDEQLSMIKARCAASKSQDMSAHYQLDVGVLLDEIDRLRYEVSRKVARPKRKAKKRPTKKAKKAGVKRESRSP